MADFYWRCLIIWQRPKPSRGSQATTVTFGIWVDCSEASRLE